ncbi:unnamed protein product [Schistocephalus solidus]|uniref:SH2 domain-containing protein n=1 Tax=Schistocephalus solidus TaxID=70667 RepID=A0A183SJK9_SCHSO|nr:unnamed protein product [Schistocephalus solidus]
MYLLSSLRWYFGDMRRLQAEQCLLLHGNDQGSFLVRASESRSGEYSLSGQPSGAPPLPPTPLVLSVGCYEGVFISQISTPSSRLPEFRTVLPL